MCSYRRPSVMDRRRIFMSACVAIANFMSAHFLPRNLNLHKRNDNDYGNTKQRKDYLGNG